MLFLLSIILLGRLDVCCTQSSIKTSTKWQWEKSSLLTGIQCSGCECVTHIQQTRKTIVCACKTSDWCRRSNQNRRAVGQNAIILVWAARSFARKYKLHISNQFCGICRSVSRERWLLKNSKAKWHNELKWSVIDRALVSCDAIPDGAD